MSNDEQQFLADLDKRLWNAADRLRANVNPSDYMHVVLGLVFLKYISDAFNERRTELEAAFRDPTDDYFLGDDAGELIEQELEARDYYTEKNVFWVPALARWDFIQAHAKVAMGTTLEVKNGKVGQLSVYGQEANPTTWRLASMNMAIRGLDFDFGKVSASTHTRPSTLTCAPTSSWPTHPST